MTCMKQQNFCLALKRAHLRNKLLLNFWPLNAASQLVKNKNNSIITIFIPPRRARLRRWRAARTPPPWPCRRPSGAAAGPGQTDPGGSRRWWRKGCQAGIENKKMWVLIFFSVGFLAQSLESKLSRQISETAFKLHVFHYKCAERKY